MHAPEPDAPQGEAPSPATAEVCKHSSCSKGSDVNTSSSGLKAALHASMLFWKPATAASRPAGAECKMCLIWHHRNQCGMRVWTAAEGVLPTVHHAEMTCIALVQPHPQSLPAPLVQVVEPAPQALLVPSPLKQCTAVEVACALTAQMQRGKSRLNGPCASWNLLMSTLPMHAYSWSGRHQVAGRPVLRVLHRQLSCWAPTWLLGVPHSQLSIDIEC